MVRIAFAAALLCLASYPAHAEQCRNNGIALRSPAICTITFDFNGSCGNVLYKYPDWADVVFIAGAWEKVPVRILSASVDAMIQTKYQTVIATIFAGNSYNADALTPKRSVAANPSVRDGTAIAILHEETKFPSDSGMQFPAGLDAPTTHIDVHLVCLPKGAGYAGSLTLTYKLDPAPAAVTAR